MTEQMGTADLQALEDLEAWIESNQSQLRSLNASLADKPTAEMSIREINVTELCAAIRKVKELYEGLPSKLVSLIPIHGKRVNDAIIIALTLIEEVLCGIVE